MTDEKTYAELRVILRNVTDPKLLPAQLRDDLTLQGDLNIDSPMLVDVVLDMEERYSIRIGDEEMDRLRTIGDLARLIPSQL